MKTDKLFIIALLLLYIMYFSQGIIYAEGSIVSQLVLLCILSICSFYLIKSFLLKRSHNYFYKIWTSFLALNVLGFIFTASVSNPYHFGMFKGVLLTLISFYPFYYVSLKGTEIKRYFIIFFIAMVVLAVAQFYTNQATILADRISDNTNVVNNSAYLFVVLIPFLFFLKKNFITYALLAILAFFIIGGAKRGALIAGGLGLFVYILYLFKAQAFEVNFKKKLKTYIVLFSGIIVVSYLAYNQFLENEFLQNRLEDMIEGNTSNRTENYTWIWEAWLGADSFLNLIFGFGFAASLEITGRHFAHNDWLEALSNFGLFGFTLYLSLFVILIRKIRKNNFILAERMQLIAITLIWFFMTLVSMFYTSLNSFIMVMVLAYIIGKRSDLNFELKKI